MKVKDAAVIDEREWQTLDDNMKLLKNLRYQHIVDINMIRIMILIWLAIAVTALIPTFRPSHSDLEKRELKTFPKFSFKDLASGDYFDDINLWFSDTFPLRDKLVSLNTKITDCFGISSVQVHGTVQTGDDIPDAIDDTSDSVAQVIITEEQSQPSEVLQEPEPQPPAVETLGALLIADNAAYEYYNFNLEVANNYSATVNRAAQILSGRSKIYSMIVPTSMEITLPENYKNSTNSSDQKKAIDYMYSLMSPDVSKVDCYSALSTHKDEYIYFRTDHHWTSLGAYYSYRELMTAKGVAPVELSTFKEYRFDGFLGSFYAESGQKQQLANSPDYVLAYEPTQLSYIHTFLESGGEADLHIVSDGNKLSAANKYLSFVCGDHPYGIMTNPTIADGSSCLVIKESYGNSMVAYLTQHYQNVYVVDYRYISKVFDGTIDRFVAERAINDVIFINNISATRSPALVNAMSAFVG